MYNNIKSIWEDSGLAWKVILPHLLFSGGKMPLDKKAEKFRGNRPNVGGVGKKTPVGAALLGTQKLRSSTNEFPILQFPRSIPRTLQTAEPAVDIKKWCFENHIPLGRSNDSTPVFILNQGNVVTVRQQNVRVPGDLNTWAEVEYTYSQQNEEKKWVTSTVSGWVNEIYLDDYVEKYPGNVVKIDNPTEDPRDAQQYMIWDKNTADASDTGVRYNMCGEFCVAYIVRKEIDPNISIESVLEKWKSAPKEKRGHFSYTLSTIKNGTTVSHLKDILQLYPEYTSPQDQDQIFMDLRTGLDLKDGPFKWDGIKDRIRTHHLIALVKIDTSGTLIPREKAGISHWVLVENVTRNGKAVELYNPFPNKLQEYSFTEFISSCSTGPLSGLWVRRKKPLHVGFVQSILPRQFEVALGITRPPGYQGAEQYIDREGGKKTNLCGEFSVAYILSESLDRTIMHWKAKQSTESGEFLKMLKAYGYFDDKASNSKPFTIGTVLDHWRDAQLELYKHHVVDNQPTGPRELVSILTAYGYNNPGDYVGFQSGLTDPVTKKYLPSPGRMRKMLKTHFLIAGVGINNITGQLKSPGGTRHWVVVEKITPVGKHYLTRHFGGSGGWVELYNPFTNVLEEYSYLEFTNSMSETGLWDGLWVKRDIDPVFKSQTLMFPVAEQATGRPNNARTPGFKKAAASSKWKMEKLRAEIAKKLVNKKDPELVLKLMVQAGTGWSMQEIANFIPDLKKPDSAQTGDLKALEDSICRSLDVDSIPPEVGEWISSHSKGNSTLAVDLASALCNHGILTFENRKGRFNNGPLSAFQPVNKVASVIGPVFARKVMEEIGVIQARLANEAKIAATVRSDDTAANQIAHVVVPSPELKIFRVRKYGDPIMMEQAGADFRTKDVPSNFGVIPLYCPEDETWSAIAKFVKLNRSDIDQLYKMQIPDQFAVNQKMNWLIRTGDGVRPMWTGDESADWKSAQEVRAGVMLYAGQLVAVDGDAEFITPLRGDNPAKIKVKMKRIVCFRRADWGKTHATHPHLVVKATAVRGNNIYNDQPRGVIYSPVMFDPRDFPFAGGKQVKAFYIPEAWLEPKDS